MTESAASRNHKLDRPEDPIGARTVPILEPPIIKMSAPSPGEPMDVTTPTTPSAPASAARSPETEANGNSSDRSGTTTENEKPPADSGIMPAPVTTTPAPAVHQPKIVQTAFIHKLYNMLEDSTISHLISWSPTNESFVMTPSHDFAKVLAQYFKHTNISSFVRQLNMYGFHKGTFVHSPRTPKCSSTDLQGQSAMCSITAGRRQPCGSSNMETTTSSEGILWDCGKSSGERLDTRSYTETTAAPGRSRRTYKRSRILNQSLPPSQCPPYNNHRRQAANLGALRAHYMT
jgi:hypothetical protein